MACNLAILYCSLAIHTRTQDSGSTIIYFIDKEMKLRNMKNIHLIFDLGATSSCAHLGSFVVGSGGLDVLLGIETRWVACYVVTPAS